MMDTPGTLHQQVEEFGQETAELLCATLPGLPDPPVRILRYEDRFVISPPDSKPLPLYISGEHLADMKVSIACQLDSVGHYLVSSLHVPLGGSRFRPCLEDFVQFLIYECAFDSCDGWRTVVEDGRERWRRRQAAAVVRDAPDEAVRVLRNLGYTVQKPDPLPDTKNTTLRSW